MALANCPACGGPIEFQVGSSVVLVCDHCRSVVARTDRGLEDLGKVAALVDTGSPLRRGLPGRIRGAGFRIVGRTQMRHPMGGVWDEWYAAFDDGQWGWIAEAQGRFYLTVRKESAGLPPYDVLQVGGMYDGMTVTEISTATVVSGEGEIPFRVEPGSTYSYADLSGANRRFATIDYSEDPPLLFEGEQTTLADLGVDVRLEPGREAKVRVEKLSCANCGGALALVAPDQSERIVCPNCGAVHDVQQGNLQYLQTLEKRGPQPLIPLGTHGHIGNEEYIVAGFMQRSVTFDQKYYWTEYLLFAPRTKSFAWLVEDEGHWSFVLPVNAGDVKDHDPAGRSTRIESHGTTFRIFQDSVATVESVLGEFYWKVQAGEQARAIDYIAPPEGISKEISTGESREINYSHAQYMTPDAIEAAFGIRGLPRPMKLGTLQPGTKGGCALGGMWLLLVVALGIAALVVFRKLPHREVFSESYRMEQYATADQAPNAATTTTGTAAGGWSGGGGTSTAATDTSTTSTASTATTTTGTATQSGGEKEGSAVIFTKPFQLGGGHKVAIRGSTSLNNDWLYVGGDLFNEQTGFVQPFEMKLEHYEGYEDGEHWTEGSTDDTEYLAKVPAGTYSLRLEAHWDGTKPPPVLQLRVVDGVGGMSGCFLFVLALILITLPALFSWRQGTEGQRWTDAMFTPDGRLNE